MYYDTACKIFHAPLRQQTVGGPDHVYEWKIHEDQPAREEQEIGLERDAIRKCTRDQGRRDDREHHLISDVDDEWDARIVASEHGVKVDSPQEGIVGGIAH